MQAADAHRVRRIADPDKLVLPAGRTLAEPSMVIEAQAVLAPIYEHVVAPGRYAATWIDREGIPAQEGKDVLHVLRTKLHP